MARHFCSIFVLTLAALFASRNPLPAEATNPATNFKEVYDLLRTNLAGATDENLNRAAVEGLLSRLHGKVLLVGGATDGLANPQGGTALSKSVILENDVVFLRAGRVAGNLANELSVTYRELTTTNKIAGVVLDLRFADGDDYTAAQAAADLFVSKKAVPGPVIVLVNGETRGAAEALAAALRDAGAGLIIGNPTAGEAMTFHEFPLRSGERLRIATAPVKSGNGPAVPSGGLQPDITVAASADDERAFWENPYALPAQNNSNAHVTTNTLLPFVDHTSEADLVRAKRNGGNTNEDSATARAAEPQKPVLRDPVMARAVDLIKGLAVVRKSRS